MKARTLYQPHRTLMMVVSLLAITACQDAATPSGPTTPLNTSPRQSAPSVKATRARDGVHRDNAKDWVGREHNRLLREFKHRLAQPGVLTRSMCDYLVTFVADADGGDQRAMVLAPQSRRETARDAIRPTGLCTAATTAALPASLAHRSTTPQEVLLSTAATDLTNRVLEAIDLSKNSYDLATRLSPVLKAAATLNAVEREIIEATVSVAQNSYEYWETELPAMESQFYNDYHGCLDETYRAGYTEDSGRNACLNGGIAFTLHPAVPRSVLSNTLSLASYGVAYRRQCGLSRHYKRLAGADAIGAATGATRGGAAGAAGGAAAASLASFLRSTWEIYWCAMGDREL